MLVKNTLRVGFLFVALMAAFPGCSSDPDPSSCEGKRKAFSDFIASHGSCSTDADCAVIGDCGPNGDFEAVQKAHAGEAFELMAARCEQVFDGPLFEPKCVQGRCALGETDNCCGCHSE